MVRAKTVDSSFKRCSLVDKGPLLKALWNFPCDKSYSSLDELQTVALMVIISVNVYPFRQLPEWI